MNPRRRNSRHAQSVAALSKAETTEASFTAAPTRSASQVSMNLGFKPVRFAGTKSQRGSLSVQRVGQLNLPPSEQISLRHRVKAAGRRQRFSARKCCVGRIKFMASFGHQPTGSGSAMSQVSSEPNHSVKLTRNSVPHWPGEARYAHNASPVQRVTLSHAPYLKR
jgi:hypothetical protein